MGMNSTQPFPLFPLPMAVLPGEVTALHIFEPRYRDMLEACLDQPGTNGDFVMLFSREDAADEVGCAVEISKVLHAHEDGRYDILVAGRERVRVLTRFQLHSYDSVKVELCDKEEDWDEGLATEVYALHRQLLVACTGDEPADAFYQERRHLSFPVAACSGFSTEEKRRLLSFDHENERLAYVKGHLERMLPFMQRAVPLWKNILGTYSLSQMDADADSGN